MPAPPPASARVHPPSYLAYGLWQESSGYFNVEQRLVASKALHLTLPLAPMPIFMPEHNIINATVVGQVGFAEWWIREVFLKIFRTCNQHKRPFVFADTGSNEGTWTMLAAAHGCHVIAADPQPLCLSLLNAGVKRTGVASHVETHNRVLAPADMSNGSMWVPNDQCHGTSEYLPHLKRVSDTTMAGRGILGRRTTRQEVWPISFDEMVGPSRVVDLWHLDVEGAEVTVLRSARRLFSERRIRRVMLEFIPFRWVSQNVKITKGHDELKALFRDWKCTVVCPNAPEHHEQPFTFDTKDTFKHVWVQTPRGRRMICENIYCVDPRPSPHRIKFVIT